MTSTSELRRLAEEIRDRLAVRARPAPPLLQPLGVRPLPASLRAVALPRASAPRRREAKPHDDGAPVMIVVLNGHRLARIVELEHAVDDIARTPSSNAPASPHRR